MNRNMLVVGGVIVAILIGWFIWYSMGTAPVSPTTGTSTPVTSTSPTDQTTPVQAPTVGAPTSVTGNTVAPTDTTVVVSGTVTPNGALTSYGYEYGTTASLGKKTISANVGSGFVPTGAPMYITGLTKDTKYFYRLSASNEFGTSNGEVHTFQTTHNVPAPVGSSPVAKTLAATGITSGTANVNGEVTPNKVSTQYWFEYGTTAGLGNTTGLVAVNAATAKTAAQASLTNLLPGTTYHYRLDAQNQFGTVNGTILTFKTAGTAVAAALPVVTTQVASPIATTTATLRGTVNPYSVNATYWFEYSTNSNFTANQLKTTTKRSTGSVALTFSIEANVSGLQSGTTYYYRTVAQNSAGTVRGDSATFKTK